VIWLEGGAASRLRVTGALDGRTVRRIFDAIARGAVVLDLSGVETANDSAVAFIAGLPRERCSVAASPSWLSRALERLQSRGANGASVDETGRSRDAKQFH
jgi:hypothetical protein